MAAARSMSRRRRRPDALPGVGVLRAARRGAVGRLGGEVDRAHVLVDARGEAVRRGAIALDARPVAHGAARGGELARLPEGERHQAQDGGIGRLGVAREDQALGGQRVVALGHRVLGGGHEALHALGAGVGLGEVDELQRAGRDRAHAGRELHARPLLDVVAGAREVDARDRADAPLRVAQAARVAVHDRVVGHARAERVVLGLIGGRGAGALLGLVGAAALLGARLARGGGADLDRVARHAPAARALGQRDELVGGVVDRLQVALVLELAPGRREVGMPDLGQPAARELDVALVERRLDLQQEERLLDLEHCGHEHPTIAPRSSGEESWPEHCIQRAAHATGERAAAIDRPIELGAVEDGVHGVGQSTRVAGLELARGDGRIEQRADRAAQSAGVGDGERAQLRDRRDRAAAARGGWRRPRGRGRAR